MEIPRSGPMFACPNGHFVCKKCKTGSCPTCRVEMGNGKSLLAITVIENIDHKCKFAECEELFAMEKLEAHEKVCKHRVVKCPLSVCGEEVALSNLVEHLGKKPCSSNTLPYVIETSSKTGKCNFRLTSISSLGNTEFAWKSPIYSYRDTNFVICARKFGALYHFTMVMFDTEEVCSKFKIDMEVFDLDSSCQDSELSIRFRGNPCSIDEDKVQVQYLGLTVHHKIMEKMILGTKDHTFTVSFSFSEKRAREPCGVK